MLEAQISGPVNLTSPHPVTNGTFTRTLAHVLRRPALLPVPALLLRLLFGELAEATLLAGQRAQPTRLDASAFRFAYPALEAALQDILLHD
jgi:NAD dependent epimerase/dehydratase family enzyme